MSKWIERYIHAVTKRLPEAMRTDVHDELRAHIADMTPDNPSDDDLLKVFRTLGHPTVLASKYRGKEQYVIHPTLYFDYVNTLKVVGIIFVMVMLITGTIKTLTDMNYDSIWDAFSTISMNLFGDMFSGLFTAFAWVTIVFWILSKTEALSKSDWKLNDLPDLPEPTHVTISRKGTLIELSIGLIFGIAWIVVLAENLIIVNGSIPVFDSAVVAPFILFYVLEISFTLIEAAWKLRVGRWNFQTIIPSILVTIFGAAVAVAFLNAPGLINPAIYELIAEPIGESATTVEAGFNTGIYWITIIVVVGNLIDIASNLVKAYKGSKK